MPRVLFTPNLQRHVDCPEVSVEGDTVRLSLDAVFANRPQLRGYVIDEHDRLRKHMVVFVNGQPVKDRTGLSDAVAPDAEIFVMQALSGG
ncbi:MAG: thiamine biosynthesis protein ThiS [Planctomyces sp.]|nr:thiamine biosynthesis protein ThiS [Planctomyces sp.]